MAKIMEDQTIRFICKICGIIAPQPILCVKDNCPTEALVTAAASLRKH